MTKRLIALTCTLLLTSICLAPEAHAGLTLKQLEEKGLTFGGLFQLQYHYQDAPDGTTEQELFFRRLRFDIQANVYTNWSARFQFDLGLLDPTETAQRSINFTLKDIFVKYYGVKGVEFIIGNAKFPYSWNILIPSSKMQLVERPFVGDNNFGSPGRALGIHSGGQFFTSKVTWRASLADFTVDPDVTLLNLRSPLTTESTYNDGYSLGARLDYYLLGYVPPEQGYFGGSAKTNIGVSGFHWDNNGTNNTFTDPDTGLSDSPTEADVDEITGAGLSWVIRGGGFSADLGYNYFDAVTVDSTFTGGIYVDGSTTLTNWTAQGGYMLKPGKIEVVAAIQGQDADGYDKQWGRVSAGVNWYIKGQNAKLQLTYQVGENVNGVDGDQQDDLYVQAQFAF
jgi:phosphate-selective porin OprO/OprP